MEKKLRTYFWIERLKIWAYEADTYAPPGSLLVNQCDKHGNRVAGSDLVCVGVSELGPASLNTKGDRLGRGRKLGLIKDNANFYAANLSASEVVHNYKEVSDYNIAVVNDVRQSEIAMALEILRLRKALSKIEHAVVTQKANVFNRAN